MVSVRTLLCSLLVILMGRGWCDDTIHLFTEDFPPYSMAVNGSGHAKSAENITGYSSEVIKELFRRVELPYTLELLPWKRAYEKALSKTNHAVFSTTRTAERENLFHWVGPITKNTWVFMALESSQIKLTSLNQAHNYSVGGYLEDAVASYLVEQGINVEYVANDILNVRKLAKGRIDLWPVVKSKGASLARSEGIDVKEVFVIKRTEMALAFNKNTDPDTIARLDRMLADMFSDGTVDIIRKKFLE